MTLTSPAATVPISLPWMTGNPYALYARVRGIAPAGNEGRWSAPYGFNMRWRDRPGPLDPQFPGLVRWTPIEGATMYEVWLAGSTETFFTTTNVADEREFYAFHTQPWWIQSVNWRVRAVRKVYGEIPTGMPRVTFGAWSDWFTNVNPPFNVDFNPPYNPTPAEIALAGTVSGDVVSTPASPQAHELIPAFRWTGNYRSWGQPGFLDTDHRALPRLRLHRQRMREPRLHQRDRRRPCVRAAARADARLPRHVRRPQRRADMRPSTATKARASCGRHSGHGCGRRAHRDRPLGHLLAERRLLLDRRSRLRRADPADASKIMEYRDIQLPEDVCRAGGAGALRQGRASRFSSATRPRTSRASRRTASSSGDEERFAVVLRLLRSSPGSPSLGAHDYEVQWSSKLNPWRTQPARAHDGGDLSGAAADPRALVLPRPRPEPLAAG